MSKILICPYISRQLGLNDTARPYLQFTKICDSHNDVVYYMCDELRRGLMVTPFYVAGKRIKLSKERIDELQARHYKAATSTTQKGYTDYELDAFYSDLLRMFRAELTRHGVELNQVSDEVLANFLQMANQQGIIKATERILSAESTLAYSRQDGGALVVSAQCHLQEKNGQLQLTEIVHINAVARNLSEMEDPTGTYMAAQSAKATIQQRVYTEVSGERVSSIEPDNPYFGSVATVRSIYTIGAQHAEATYVDIEIKNADYAAFIPDTRTLLEMLLDFICNLINGYNYTSTARTSTKMAP